jgi:transposase
LQQAQCDGRGGASPRGAGIVTGDRDRLFEHLRANYEGRRQARAPAYLRQRERLLDYAAAHIQHMQKALTQMNLQIHHVISDITGGTGMRIIRAIVAGERDPDTLAW